MKVLFLGYGDIALRAIRQLRDSTKPTFGNVICHAVRRRVEALPTTVQATAGDIRDIEAMIALMDAGQFDAVVVTMTPDSMSDQGYRDSYVAGASALATAVERTRYKPSGVIWVSSTGVYGQSHGEWVDELMETLPTSYRGKRLLEAEGIIQHLPVPSVVVRYSGVYGPGRGRLLQQIRQGHIAPAEPIQWSNRIHADDAAGVLVHLLQKFLQGELVEPCYLATDNEPVPLHDVHAWLAGQIGATMPAGLSNDAGESGTRTGNRRCRNQRLRNSGFVFRYPTFREGYLQILAENTE
ncbi:NAD-dependent epimerase/dehydratase family protein [Porticoccus sp.]